MQRAGELQRQVDEALQGSTGLQERMHQLQSQILQKDAKVRHQTDCRDMLLVTAIVTGTQGGKEQLAVHCISMVARCRLPLRTSMLIAWRRIDLVQALLESQLRAQVVT